MTLKSSTTMTPLSRLALMTAVYWRYCSLARSHDSFDNFSCRCIHSAFSASTSARTCASTSLRTLRSKVESLS